MVGMIRLPLVDRVEVYDSLKKESRFKGLEDKKGKDLFKVEVPVFNESLEERKEIFL